jgi:hypothetical protein
MLKIPQRGKSRELSLRMKRSLCDIYYPNDKRAVWVVREPYYSLSALRFKIARFIISIMKRAIYFFPYMEKKLEYCFCIC